MRTDTQKRRSDALKRNVTIAIFCALAYATEWIFHIKVAFLTFDIKDSIITVAAMLFGPLSAFAMGFAVALIELFTVSTEGLYGFVMNVLSTVTFSAVSSLIYKHKKTLFGAVFALLCGVFSMTAVMMLANLLITPFYMGVSVVEVVKLLPTLLLPFNLTKALLNASLVMMLYKPLVTALRRARVIGRRDALELTNELTPEQRDITDETVSPRGDGTKNGRLRSSMVFIGAAVVLAVCFVVFFAVLNGTFEWL